MDIDASPTRVAGRPIDSRFSRLAQSRDRVRRFTSRGHTEPIERDAAGARTRTILDDGHDARDALGRESMRALHGAGASTELMIRSGDWTASSAATARAGLPTSSTS